MKGEDLEILCNRLQYVLEPVVCFADMHACMEISLVCLPVLGFVSWSILIYGAEEGANECFSDSAIPRIQQQHLSETCYQNLNVGNEDRSVPSSRFTSSGDSSSRQSKQLHANNLWEPHGTMGSGQSSNNIPNLSQYNTPSPTATQLSGVAPPPLCRNAQQYLNANALGADSSTRLNANFAIQARRKVLDDGKIRKVGKHILRVDFLDADRIFDLARRVSPYTLEGMDIYSTVLFHLKEEMKLSYLAQDLISTDRLSPQAWCAMGNCYSLLKDHETALKFFSAL